MAPHMCVSVCAVTKLMAHLPAWGVAHCPGGFLASLTLSVTALGPEKGLGTCSPYQGWTKSLTSRARRPPQPYVYSH